FEPEADFVFSDNPVVEGQEVTLKDKSTHEGKQYGEQIVSWEWDIEGLESASGQEVKVKWDNVGTYKVKLEVEDQDRDDDSCTKSIVVGPAIPTAQITLSDDSIVLGREIHINGDESRAAMGRDIKWEEMEWEIYDPDGTKVPYLFSKSHLFNDQKDKTNEILNKVGNWKFRLKVKDTKDNESEWDEKIVSVFPDLPPKAEFWLTTETVRYSYKWNELIVYDRSELSYPDGSLGDEIFKRDWVLYYDSNNNGNFNEAADEVILPNQTGKSALLQITGENDTNPKIRFNKTGRYKVELVIKERAYVWGELIEGYSDDTLDKVAEEKEVLVINLAPTVSFDIKKKVPADILFATDYTASDAKYSSLQSGQAEFINKLFGAYIDPTVEVNKVQEGELGEIWQNGHTLQQKLNRYYYVGKIFGDWYQCRLQDARGTLSDFSLNISTGEVKGYYGDLYAELNDGSIILRREALENDDLSRYIINPYYTKVDKDMNILISSSSYNSIVRSFLPPDVREEPPNYYGRYKTTRHYLGEVIFNPDGTMFIWDNCRKLQVGEDYLDISLFETTGYLIKVDNNFNLLSNTQFYHSYANNENIALIHAFKEHNQVVFGVFTDEVNTNYKLRILSVGDKGTKILLNSSGKNNYTPWYGYGMSYPARKKWSNNEVGATGISQASVAGTDGICGASFYGTINGKYFIAADVGSLKIFNQDGGLVTNIGVPTGGAVTDEEYPSSGHTGYSYSYVDWGNQTAVIYQIIKVDPNGKDKDGRTIYGNFENTYIFLVNNETGLVDKSKQFYRELYPDEIGKVGWGQNYSIRGSRLNNNFLGIVGLYDYIRNRDNDDREIRYYSVVDRNLNVVWRSQALVNTEYDGRPSWIGRTGSFCIVDENTIGFSTQNWGIYDSEVGDYVDTYQIDVFKWNGSNFQQVAQQNAGKNVGAGRLKNGYFWITDGTNTRMFNSSGGMIWKKTLVPVSSLFLGNYIFTKASQVVKVTNGEVKATLPYTYIFNDDNILMLQNNVSGTELELRGFGQLQGLKYLGQVLNNHAWDGNKVNFLVSVIDGPYMDFNSGKADIEALLRNNHVKFASISPTLAKLQTEEMANNGEGGFWVQTAGTMPGPLQELADK
ncbi:MAG TPA: hypothetical protein DC024_01820, partial [Clostridiales bacterium]|nr:hypothetical protein [Clostridiales bacterium]